MKRNRDPTSLPVTQTADPRSRILDPLTRDPHSTFPFPRERARVFFIPAGVKLAERRVDESRVSWIGTCVEALEHQRARSSGTFVLLWHVGGGTGCRIPIDLLTEPGSREFAQRG